MFIDNLFSLDNNFVLIVTLHYFRKITLRKNVGLIVTFIRTRNDHT